MMLLAALQHTTLSSAMSIEPQPTHQPSQNLQVQQNVIHHIPSFAGVGITSILPVPSTNGKLFYVGTKRGKVKQIELPEDLRDASQAIHIRDIVDANGKTLKPYPIFSMISMKRGNKENSHDLLAGGGDRHVTVWRESTKVMGEGALSWKVVDQLGPHTGWVKDLASCSCSCSANSMQHGSDCEDDVLYIFSIGCNCIEVWSAVDGRYQHERKLQIESSVEMGSTLSSDLLCLATHSECGKDGSNTNYLFAGGVDGRIHRWRLHNNNNNNFPTAGVISAHDGRVNAMAVCQAMHVLISVGNDGCVHCRAMDNAELSKWKVTSLDLADCGAFIDRKGSKSPSTQRKITSLHIVHEELNSASIAIGTSCGQVSLVNIIKSEDNELHLSFLKDSITIIGLDDGEGKVIHALCCSRQYKNLCGILVAHSDGLSVWDLSLGSLNRLG